MIRTLVSTLIVAAALASGAPAFAQDTMSVKVDYSDLNLNTAAGAKVFHQRLQDAVDRICSGGDLGELATLSMVRKCQSETWVSASQVERRALTDAQRLTQLAAASQPPGR